MREQLFHGGDSYTVHDFNNTAARVFTLDILLTLCVTISYMKEIKGTV